MRVYRSHFGLHELTHIYLGVRVAEAQAPPRRRVKDVGVLQEDVTWLRNSSSYSNSLTWARNQVTLLVSRGIRHPFVLISGS